MVVASQSSPSETCKPWQPTSAKNAGDDGLVLTGYNNYALQAPPHGLTWIRVGSDALLVDRKTGEVVETDYGLFKS